MEQGEIVIVNVFKNLLSRIKKITSENLSIQSEEIDKKSGLIILIVKINGRCSPLIKKDPFELLREIGHKAAFSKKDFDLIIDSALKNQKKVTEMKYLKPYSLINHQFSGQLEEPLIVYKDITNDQVYIKAAKEIFSDIEIIRKFNAEDSICIGHIVGCHETERESKLCQAQKQEVNNIINFDTSVFLEQKG